MLFPCKHFILTETKCDVLWLSSAGAKTLGGLLNNFFDPEFISGVNAPRCPTCGAWGQASKSHALEDCSALMCVSIGRPEGELNKSITVGFDNVEIGASTYRLIAFCQHSGESSKKGHYVAYVRTKGNQWYLFDDHLKPRLMTPQQAVSLAAKSYYFIYQNMDQEVLDAVKAISVLTTVPTKGH
jgi:ubiquitin C-terminal hydrolase